MRSLCIVGSTSLPLLLSLRFLFFFVVDADDFVVWLCCAAHKGRAAAVTRRRWRQAAVRRVQEESIAEKDREEQRHRQGAVAVRACVRVCIVRALCVFVRACVCVRVRASRSSVRFFDMQVNYFVCNHCYLDLKQKYGVAAPRTPEVLASASKSRSLHKGSPDPTVVPKLKQELSSPVEFARRFFLACVSASASASASGARARHTRGSQAGARATSSAASRTCFSCRSLCLCAPQMMLSGKNSTTGGSLSPASVVAKSSMSKWSKSTSGPVQKKTKIAYLYEVSLGVRSVRARRRALDCD